MPQNDSMKGLDKVKKILVLLQAEHNAVSGMIMVPDEQVWQLSTIEHQFNVENYDELGNTRWETLTDLLMVRYPQMMFVEFDGHIEI